MSDAEKFEDFLRAMSRGPWSAPDHARGRVAAALRRLAHRNVAYHLPDDDPAWGALADRLEALLDGADPDPATSRYEPSEVRNIDRPVVRPNSRGTHPLVGTANPVAPPLDLSLTEDGVAADTVYDARHEGLPGFVQGGFIAAAFDLILGQAVARAGGRGVTGGLSVKYLVTTPIGVPLRYESWAERTEGRKTWAKAKLIRVSDGVVTAEAEGIFIAPKQALYSTEL